MPDCYLFVWSPEDVLPNSLDPPSEGVRLYGPGWRDNLVVLGNRLQAEAEAAGDPIPGYVVVSPEHPPSVTSTTTGTTSAIRDGCS